MMSSYDPQSLEAKAKAADLANDSSGAPVPDAPVPGPTAPPRRWSLRFKVLSGAGILLAAALLVSSLVSIPYYALTPGSAQSVLRLIGLPPAKTHDHTGAIDLVDVEITSMRAIDWIYFELDPSASIYSSAAIQGPETNAQYNTEGVLDMADARQAAKVVALTELGYRVSVVPNGSLVYALDPGSPAEAALQVGDVIVKVGARRVTSPAALSAALFAYRAGQAVSLRFRAYPSGVTKSATLHLGVWRWQGAGVNQQLTCVPTDVRTSDPVAKLFDDQGVLYAPSKKHPGSATPCIGVLGAEPAYAVRLPFPVNLNSEGIVGPSAGLAFTLGLIEKLDAGDLTGGRQVAATGTMSVTGAVGAIGGIRQKTIAVRAAGASIFLVPRANYAVAEHNAGPKLKVFAVSTIGQALGILERLGGRLVKVGPG